MQRIRDNLPLLAAFVLSLSLHVVLVLPAMGVLGGNWGGLDLVDSTEVVARAPDETGDDAKADTRTAKRHEAAQRSAESARRTLQHRSELDRLKPEELRAREELVRLGIDESNAVTMNWIGYDEYERHLAELAEVEQAAFRLQASSGSQGSASPLLPPAPPSPEVGAAAHTNPVSPTPPASVEPQPPSAALPAAPQPTTIAVATPPTPKATRAWSEAEFARPLPPPEASEQISPPLLLAAPTEPGDDPPEEPLATPTSETAPSPAEAVDNTRPAPPVESPTRTDPTADPRTDDAKAPPSQLDPTKISDPAPSGRAPDAEPRTAADRNANEVQPPIDGVETRDDSSTAPDNANASRNTASATDPNVVATDASEQVAPAQDAQANQPRDGATGQAQPSPAGSVGDAQSKVGELSDRESDPTSTIDVPATAWRTGRPLAAKGIVLRPVRPQFFTLTRISGILHNPIGEIVLGRDGVPQAARIVRSSGNPGVDEAIRSALFKWRASGAPLERLKPGQTVAIRLKLVMLDD